MLNSQMIRAPSILVAAILAAPCIEGEVLVYFAGGPQCLANVPRGGVSYAPVRTQSKDTSFPWVKPYLGNVNARRKSPPHPQNLARVRQNVEVGASTDLC